MFTDHAILKEQLKMSEQWVFCHGPVIISKEQAKNCNFWGTTKKCKNKNLS